MRSDQWNHWNASYKPRFFDLAFFIRFVVGLIGGAFLGLIFVVNNSGAATAWTLIIAIAIICGIVWAFSGDVLSAGAAYVVVRFRRR